MKHCRSLLASLLLAMAGANLFGTLLLPGLAYAEQAAPDGTEQGAQVVEYATLPGAAAAASQTATPDSRNASSRPARRQATARTSPAPTPATKPAPAAPVSAPDLEPVGLLPALEEPLPPWRVAVADWLTPLGITALLAKMGLSGPAADILGCLLLLLLGGILFFLLLRISQAIRHHVADKLRQKREMEPLEKIEPAIDPSRLKQPSRSGSASRLAANSRNGPHSRPNSDTRTGPASRLQPHTRGGPDSRLGAPTRSGPAHSRSLDSRMVHDTQAPDSRMYPGTRGPTGLQSQFGESQFGNSMLGHAGLEPRGHNPVVQKSDIPNAPPDFDQARFLRKARVYFLRLQLAWDKSDLASIRQFAAGPIFNEFRKQILERGDTANTTDVLAIQTELIGIEIAAGNYIASVKFTGTIKETENPAEAPFEEVWNLSMPREKKGDWVLSGIAQYK